MDAGEGAGDQACPYTVHALASYVQCFSVEAADGTYLVACASIGGHVWDGSILQSVARIRLARGQHIPEEGIVYP